MIYAISTYIERIKDKDIEMSIAIIFLIIYSILIIYNIISIIIISKYTLFLGILEFIKRMIIPFVIDIIALKLHNQNK